MSSWGYKTTWNVLCLQPVQRTSLRFFPVLHSHQASSSLIFNSQNSVWISYAALHAWSLIRFTPLHHIALTTLSKGYKFCNSPFYNLSVLLSRLHCWVLEMSVSSKLRLHCPRYTAMLLFRGIHVRKPFTFWSSENTSWLLTQTECYESNKFLFFFRTNNSVWELGLTW